MKGYPYWSAREVAVVDRFVRSLRAGRYYSASEAARACYVFLAATRRRSVGSKHPLACRSVFAVASKLKERARSAGVSASGYDWQPAELGVIRSWVTKFGGNPSLGRHDAVRGCWRELTRLRERRRSGPALPVRSARAVEQKLAEALRATGLGHHRQPGEMKVVRRYVRAYRAGRYPSMRAAAAACTRELSRTARRPRPFYGVYWLLHSTAHAMGVPKLKDEWSAAEKRVLNRHLRLLFQRRYEYARDAAQGCYREMGGSRSFKAVLFALRTKATRMGLPRFHSHLTPVEERLAERYALMVHRGELPHWRAAAEQCHAALLRRNAGLARTGPLRLRHPPSHTLDTIHLAILKIAHRRNLRGPRNPHWTEAEDKILAPWVRWYARYRHVTRLAPLQQAGEGLHNELADKGFQRSIGACESRISNKTREAALR